MKAITAAVIAILNVNIRFRPLAHCSSEEKRDRGATAEAPLVADRVWDRRRRESQARAVRPAFEPADFGQIAAPKAGSETELRNIEPSLRRVTACWLCNFGRNTCADPQHARRRYPRAAERASR